MTKRILHLVTHVDRNEDVDLPAGLWLSELTHAFDLFEARGYTQRIVSPKGGVCPLEPRALKWPWLDTSAKAWLANDAKMALLANTSRPDGIGAAKFDAIYFTGGHAVMWDFPNSAALQHITRHIFDVRRHRFIGLPQLLRLAQHHVVTGQNPMSAKATAKQVVSMLSH